MSIVLLRCRVHNRGEKARPLSLVQFAFDSGGQRARRQLTQSGSELVKGSWQHSAQPFAAGLYCQYCLDAGQREPLPNLDDQDIADVGLGDVPLVFQSPAQFDATTFTEKLVETFGSRIQCVREFPPQPGVYTSPTLFNRLHPGVQQALRERILPDGGALYEFQARAIDASLRGNDVVVTTPTASGKSLTYTVPVLDSLLRDRSATALYLSPLVALTGDQLEAVTRFDCTRTDWTRRGERFSIHRVLRTLEIGAERLTIARYDGSVSRGDRQDIRSKRPQYLLTTPDMVHQGLLLGAFNDRQWLYLFRGLQYVVIDELHTYRGILGASFANLLRRLQRICQRLGSNPRFLCASATMTDPADTVERLIGRRPVLIDAGTSEAPLHRRHFVLWNSAAKGDALSTEAKNLLLFLVAQRVRSIAFARSISEINDIYRFVQAELRQSGLVDTPLRPFMRELLPEEKRKTIDDLKQGRLHGVISTTALSMGIDIGTLSVAAIFGFPGSIAQLWQQAGRAGRNGEGVVVMIADTNPMDQFFVNHPDVLFDLRAEPVYCNPDNPYIVRSHLLQAAREAPLEHSELALFGPAAAPLARELVDSGTLLVDAQERYSLPASEIEAEPTPFRNLSFSIDVLTEERTPVVQVDAIRAQRALHLFAHYQHVDDYYRVVHCDLDMQKGYGRIIVQPIERPEFLTTAKVERTVHITTRERHYDHPRYTIAYGVVRCATTISGYYKVPLFARGERFEFQPLGRAAPPAFIYETQAFWLTLDPALLWEHPAEERESGLTSCVGALRLATAIEELCDPADVESLAVEQHPSTGAPILFIYDAAPGGVGISEAAFAVIERVLLRAEQILADCPYCTQHPESRGCPYCVTAEYGDEHSINRHVALELLRRFRSH